MLEWLIDQQHVGTPDAAIRAEVESRLRPNVTPAQRRALVRRALARHHANQRLYLDVVGARIR